MKLTICLLLFALAGCETSATLSGCGGQAFGLNSAHWRPSAAELKACSAPVRGQ
jgi:hypothetical protein